MADGMIAREVFLTSGIGFAVDELVSFEKALRQAGIAPYNLVSISSIFPPHALLVKKEVGLPQLKPGQILFSVLSRLVTNEHGRFVTASVGLALPRDKSRYGYISEYHAHGVEPDAAGEHAEDMAAMMLGSCYGDPKAEDLPWDEDKDLWKINGEIVHTCHATAHAMGLPGKYTTVVAAAVFVF